MDHKSLLWGMAWAHQTITEWTALFGRETAEHMCKDPALMNGLGAEEHRLALLTAWGE